MRHQHLTHSSQLPSCTWDWDALSHHHKWSLQTVGSRRVGAAVSFRPKAVVNIADYYLLVYHLANMGIHRVALQWLTSFLPGWGQRVPLGEESSIYPLESGVPQGAICFPMLFNTYMYPLAMWSFRLCLMMGGQPDTVPSNLVRDLVAVVE